MWWKGLLIGIAAFIAVILIGKFVNGLSGIWKGLCFPFLMVYKLFCFIFKR